MAYKYYNHRKFEFAFDGINIVIDCATQNTSYGFRHVAESTIRTSNEYLGASYYETAKACYYNRTWEAYEYQSVLFDVIHKSKHLKPAQKTGFKQLVEHYNSRDSRLESVAAIASMGQILFESNPKQSNDWAIRMLEAGLGEGISKPDDWDQLTEDEKSKRLTGAISALRS